MRSLARPSIAGFASAAVLLLGAAVAQAQTVGAGPAAAQCALTLTARQANQLDGYLREGP